jgi:glucose/arabinose dehydrogenase
MRFRVACIVSALAVSECSNNSSSPSNAPADGSAAASDAGPSPVDGSPADGSPADGSIALAQDSSAVLDQDALPAPGTFCAQPGSIVSTPQGMMTVPGPGSTAPDLSFVHVPVGFCVHYFATVRTARQLRFAPGGDLFVSSPTTATTGGANDGIAGIVDLSDDGFMGVADLATTFMNGLQSVQGLMFSAGYFYYQNDTNVLRVPFNTGDHTPSGASVPVTPMQVWPQAPEHWPRVFDQAMDGTIYITNGGSQSDVCDSIGAVRGGIFKLNADGSTSVVAKGMRNPIALRCESTHNVCLAAELSLDYSGPAGGREKIVPVRQGDDWGYPCCATQNLPYTGVVYGDTQATPDCSGVAAESDGFVIGATPFGIDFETGQWPAPWAGRAFVTLHGAFETWTGARLVAIALDPTTGLPLPASEVSPSPADDDHVLDFATGWDDGTNSHGRPAPLAFAPDGRLFLGDDQLGTVLWIAPVGLTP